MHFTRVATPVCVILLALANLYICAPQLGAGQCRLLDLTLQKDFKQKKFQGKWFMTYKAPMGGNRLLSYFIEVNDVRIHYKLTPKMTFNIQAVGSKFRGTWCPRGNGHAAVPSAVEPERMTTYFDTIVGRSIGMKPTWVLGTDYDNYAVLYSCWKETSRGNCDPNKAYGIILQRSSKDMKPAQRAQVDTIFRDACVDPASLTAVNHYGYCPDKDEDSL